MKNKSSIVTILAVIGINIVLGGIFVALYINSVSGALVILYIIIFFDLYCGLIRTNKKIVCSNCGEKLSYKSKFCKNCGCAVEKSKESLKCPRCGTKYTQDAKFCENCGAAINNEEITDLSSKYF